MVLLLPLCFIGLVLLMRSLHEGWRRATLEAMVVFGILVTAISELLSIPRALYEGPVILAWVCSAVVIGALLLVRWRGLRRRSVMSGAAWTASEISMLIAMAGLVLITGIVAVVAPPNTWDVLEYHLPRAFFWAQNATVANYPTPDYAQLVFSPWSEFAVLQTYILSGGDRFSNCVEYVAYTGSIVAASLIAEQLGANRLGQVLAAVICATIPEAVLEASGAMNTAVVTLWIVATVYFLLLYRTEASWWTACMAGAASGLAVLSKGSAYIYLPPLMLACLWAMPGPARLSMLARAPALASVALAVNAGAFLRNFGLTGSPLGLPFQDGGPRLRWGNDTFTAMGTVGNAIRNLALHFGTPFTAVNQFGDHLVRRLLEFIGQDPDDPSHTWAGDPGFHWPNMARHEAFAGNPLHAILFIIIAGLLIWRWRDGRNRTSLLYVAGVAGAFLLYSALLRYQIWGGRHQLPLFALLSGVAGLLLPRYAGRRAAVVVGALLIVAAVPFAVDNKLRSLVPGDDASVVTRSRDELYFADLHADLVSPTEQLVKEVEKAECENIALDARVDIPDSQIRKSVPSFYIYPMLALLHRDMPKAKVSYTNVHNLSRRYDVAGGSPACVVICLDCQSSPDALQAYRTWNAVSIGNDVILEKPLTLGRRP